MQVITRCKFVSASALLAGGTALGLYGVNMHRNQRGAICLLPIDGVIYSETFRQFMERARFDSVRDALGSIRDRRTPVRIAHFANGSFGHLPRPTESTACITRRPDSNQAAGSFS